MKHLISLTVFTFLFQLVSAQTGSLATNVDFVKDVQCATYNVQLRNGDSTLNFKSLRQIDTLENIPAGFYDITFYSCDSVYHYGQQIEILEDEVRSIYFRNNTYVGTEYNPNTYTNDYYFNYYDSLYSPIYLGVSWQFSRGIDYDGINPNLLNNYSFDYILGHDWLLTKPVAFGYEFGFGFTQANYVREDLEDPTILHEKQRFTTFDINLGLVTSIYVKESRLLALGARYRLPYFARYARVTGNDKISSKGLHRYNDFSVFAQLGYDWGFIFAEYRFDQFLRAPIGDLPNLSAGVRLTFREEY